MPNVFIARHGETTWNVTGRYQGRQESDLSPLGLAQAKALANAMAPYALKRVISSPLARCVASAQPAVQRFGLSLEREPLLTEIAHGRWEGRYRDELAANDPKRYYQWRHEPESVQFEEGESIADVLARWRRFAASFEVRGDALLVTHDAMLRVALVDRLKRPLSKFWQSRVLNGAYAWFDVEDGDWRLIDECISRHLAGLVANPSSQAL